MEPLPRRSDSIDPGAAEVAYDILVRHGQADERDRQAFVRYATDGLQEWRFIGTLGFGGKIRLAHWPERRIYVDCYAEHLTPERQETIDALNHELSKVL